MLRNKLFKLGIGDTIFTRSRNLEKKLQFEQLFLKFEGGNPTGSMKDRASFSTLQLASEKGFKEIAVASCGNFGASIVHISRYFNIKPHVYIPSGFHTPRIIEMESQGGIIHRAPGTYEDLVELSIFEAEENGWYNGNPGTLDNTRASLEAYASIANEIHEDLDDPPEAISVSVGNGTCFSGIFHGFKKLKQEGKIDKLPHMIAASTDGGNPIVQSYNMKRKKIMYLDPLKITETKINEPIVNWKSFDGQEALDALWDSKGFALNVSDEKMVDYAKLLEKEEGISIIPASAASIFALERYVKKKGFDGLYVAVLTSRRY
jgi:threonine synthase